MILIAVGPDTSMVRHAVTSQAQKADPDGQSTSELDGNKVSMGEIVQAISSVGFFSAGRVIIVHDFIARTNRNGGRGRNAPDWSALFSAVPDASTLILADPSLLRIPAAISKALPPDAETFIGDPPRGPALIKWIRGGASSLGSSMDDATARYLAERLYPQTWHRKGNNPAFDTPPDLQVIRNEVTKLATAADPGPITRQHIDELVPRGDDDRIFAWIDAVVRGDLTGATTELDRLLAAGEDPHRLLAQLGQTIELGAVLAAAGRREPAAVGKEIGLSNPNRMTAIARSMRGSSNEQAKRAVQLMADADRKLKTGKLRDPVDVLHYLMAGLAPAGGP